MCEKILVNLDSISVRFFSIIISLFATIYLINMPLIMALALRDLSLSQTEPLWLGGVFFISFGLASVLLSFYNFLINMRRLILISSIIGSISFSLPLFLTSFEFLLVCQGLSGFFTGITCSVVFLVLGASKNPIRCYALVLCMQSFIVAIISYLLPPRAAETITFNQALIFASFLCFVSLILARKIPSNIKISKLKIEARQGRQAVTQLLLFTLLLIFLGGNIVRNTIEPIAYSAGFYIVILSVSSGIGALIAALIEIRFNHTRPILISLGIAIIILSAGLLGHIPKQLTVVAFCMLSGAWNFSAAFVMGLFAKSTNNYNYIPLIISVQILGNIVSLISVGSLKVGQPYILGCIGWILAILIISYIAKLNHKLFLVKNNE